MMQLPALAVSKTNVFGAFGGLYMLLCAAVASADTLVLRDGSRVEGSVVGMRDGIVEFEARRGFVGRERIRVDRDEVVRIEFESRGDDRRDFDRDRGDSRDRNDSRDTRRPSGLRGPEVSVDSWLGWKDTGFEVRSGESVYFSASRRVRWGPNRQDGPAGGGLDRQGRRLQRVLLHRRRRGRHPDEVIGPAVSRRQRRLPEGQHGELSGDGVLLTL